MEAIAVDSMHRWAAHLTIGKLRFAVDRALRSKANLALLEQHELSYVVAMPLKRTKRLA